MAMTKGDETAVPVEIARRGSEEATSIPMMNVPPIPKKVRARVDCFLMHT